MRQELGIATALIVICILLGTVNPDFWVSANTLNTVRHTAMLSIYAIGLAFVITTGGIDLSVGSVIELSGVLVAALLAAYLLHFMKFGRYVYAIGSNREAALYSGIAVKQIELTTYVISAGVAGLAGIVYVAYVGQMSHSVGAAYELIGIAAVALGGCSLRGGSGTILGVVIGSMLMKVIENSTNMSKITYHDATGLVQEWRLNTNWQYIVIGAVILIAVIIDQSRPFLRGRRISFARP